MKKSFFSFLITLCFVAQPLAYGENAIVSKEKVVAPKQTPAEAKEAARQAAEDAKRLAEERKKVEVRKKDLNGTRWEVTVKPGNPKEKESQDVLTFQDHQIRSMYLEKKGYPATNYTITAPPEETEGASWETMTTGQAGVAFVRGEWNKDVMSGEIHEQVTKGKETITNTYYFTSLKRAAIAPTAAEEKKALDAKGDVTTDDATDKTEVKQSVPKALRSLEKGRD